MSINITLIAQMLTFGFMIWFTMKFIWPPLMNAMEARDKKIADGLAAAEKGEKALQEAAIERDRLLKEARSQAQDILGNANRQAAQIVDEAKQQAREEGERIVRAAQAEIEREVSAARDALRAKVGALAVAGAAQILKREIDAKAHADLLKELAAKV